MATGTISSTGIGSGLDIESLVAKLVDAEKKPQQLQLDLKKATVTAKLSAFGALQSVVFSLNSALASLADGSAFSAHSVTSSDSDVLTATADSDAINGAYTVKVNSIAVAQQLTSTAYASSAAVGTGTLTLEVNGETSSITIDTSNRTLSGIADAINAASDNPGVNATVITADDGDHLVLTATNTGIDNKITVTTSGGDGGLTALVYDPAPGSGVTNLTQLTPAADAAIQINGFDVTSASNTISDAIPGVTLSLLAADFGVSKTITVSQDTSTATNAINSFVSAYNSYLSVVAQLDSYDPETGDAGVLYGDGTLRGLNNKLDISLGIRVSANTTYQTLSDLGISVQEDGTLEVDAEALSTALDEAPNEVANFFSSSSGFATTLTDTLDVYYNETDGILNQRVDGLNQDQADLATDQKKLNDRMDATEARYLMQYIALDKIISQLDGISSFLTAQLDAMPFSSTSLARNS